MRLQPNIELRSAGLFSAEARPRSLLWMQAELGCCPRRWGMLAGAREKGELMQEIQAEQALSRFDTLVVAVAKGYVGYLCILLALHLRFLTRQISHGMCALVIAQSNHRICSCDSSSFGDLTSTNRNSFPRKTNRSGQPG
jgi:hypothetical protein